LLDLRVTLLDFALQFLGGGLRRSQLRLDQPGDKHASRPGARQMQCNG
jgi:hypothetical protein